MSQGYECQRDRRLFPLVDQGLVHGLPASYNPDNEKFFLHAPGTEDGTAVLGQFKRWTNLVAFAKKKALTLEVSK